MSHQVFISHSSRDRESALALCDALEKVGVVCWMAPRDIPPGSDWQIEIIEAIASTKLLMVLFSENANASANVSKEVTAAAEDQIGVIPVRLDETHPSPALRYHLAGVHWLEAYPPPIDQHAERIATVIRGRLSRLGWTPPEPVAPPPAPTPIVAAPPPPPPVEVSPPPPPPVDYTPPVYTPPPAYTPPVEASPPSPSPPSSPPPVIEPPAPPAPTPEPAISAAPAIAAAAAATAPAPVTGSWTESSSDAAAVSPPVQTFAGLTPAVDPAPGQTDGPPAGPPPTPPSSGNSARGVWIGLGAGLVILILILVAVNMAGGQRRVTNSATNTAVAQNTTNTVVAPSDTDVTDPANPPPATNAVAANEACANPDAPSAIVCADPELLRQEGELQALYTQVQGQAADAETLTQSWQSFVSNREACVQDAQPAECIRRLITDQRSILEDWNSQ